MACYAEMQAALKETVSELRNQLAHLDCVAAVTVCTCSACRKRAQLEALVVKAEKALAP